MNKNQIISKILESVSRETNISTEKILGNSREAEISDARKIFAYSIKMLLGYPDRTIAKILRRTPSTISVYLADIHSKMDIYPLYKKYIKQIIRNVLS